MRQIALGVFARKKLLFALSVTLCRQQGSKKRIKHSVETLLSI